MHGGLVLLSDGRVRTIGNETQWLMRRDRGVKYVRLCQGVRLPVALTADGEAVSLRWDWYVGRGKEPPRVVPDLTPGWRFVDVATTGGGGVFAARRFEGGSVKRFSTVHEPTLSEYEENQCIAQTGKGYKTLKVDVVTRGNPKGGTVVVKRLGRVLGKARVTSTGGTVNVPVDLSSMVAEDGVSYTIKVRVVFQGTKTVKRSKPTIVAVLVGQNPFDCSAVTVQALVSCR